MWLPIPILTYSSSFYPEDENSKAQGRDGHGFWSDDERALLVNPMVAEVITHDINYTHDIVICPPIGYCIIRSFNESLSVS